MHTITAHDLASSDTMMEKVICLSMFSDLKWECMGYSKTGNSVKFSRVEIGETNRLKQINKYVHPDTDVWIVVGDMK
jgi:hypothetical protein